MRIAVLFALVFMLGHFSFPARACFAPQMRVLTPSGYKPLRDIVSGDRVLSWHHAQKEFSENVVRTKQVARDAACYTLDAQGAISKIQVTVDHPFFLPIAESYIPIADISQTQFLLGANFKSPQTCETFLISEFTFLVDEGPSYRGDVLTLLLENPPNNFVIEGVVVHN